MGHGRLWTENEVQHALALYLRLEFGRFHARNPQVKGLAALLGRTPGAVALKLTNLAALDESLPRKGMSHASSVDRRVWAEFLASPAGVLHAFAEQQSVEPTIPLNSEQVTSRSQPQGRDVPRQTLGRIGQSFFREMILTSYRGKCALTGIEDQRLLTASHIVGWAEDESLRLVPSNGICLNALHDRAFDRHLLTFDEDYRIVVAPNLAEVARRQLLAVPAERLQMPTRFLPDQAFLQRHRQRFDERVRAAP